jgi:hypothetical protein
MLSKCWKKAVKKTKGKEASPLRERERERERKSLHSFTSYDTKFTFDVKTMDVISISFAFLH